MSKMEGKTNFSVHPKQFDGLTLMTLIPTFYDRSTPALVKTTKCIGGAAVSALYCHVMRYIGFNPRPGKNLYGQFRHSGTPTHP